MSVQSKLTAIADKIRQLTEAQGTLTLDAMGDKLNDVIGQITEMNTEISELYEQYGARFEELIGIPIGTAPVFSSMSQITSAMPGNVEQWLGTVLLYYELVFHVVTCVETLNGSIEPTSDSVAEVIAAEMNKAVAEMQNAYTAISEKGGTLPEAQIMGGMDDAIRSIPAGIEVKTASGTARTGMTGEAAVECGFKPDLVVLTGYTVSYGSSYNLEYQLSYCFDAALHEGENNYYQIAQAGSSEYSNGIMASFIRNDTGFNVDLTTNNGSQVQHLGNKSFTYKAIKYTA